MSIMDKALPNVVEQKVTTPSAEEVELAEQEVAESQGGEGVDVQEHEDGSWKIVAWETLWAYTALYLLRDEVHGASQERLWSSWRSTRPWSLWRRW